MRGPGHEPKPPDQGGRSWDADTHLGLNLPLLGRVPGSIARWAAVAGLAVWTILITPVPDVGGVPGHLGWLVLGATVAASTAIGSRTAQLRLALVLAVGAAGYAVGLAVTIYGLDHVAHVATQFIATRGAERLGLAAGAIGLTGVLIGRRRQLMVQPAELVMVAVIGLFLINDWYVVHSQLMRDLRLYLAAGDAFFHGQQPYLTGLFTTLPADRADLPFLYPPLTLPFFALLSQLPELPVLLVWLGASLAAAVAGLRRLGVRPWAIAVLLLWPSFFEGLAVGNVAVLTFAVFALAPRWPTSLPWMAVFKLQSAIPSLWLVRERRWRSGVVGVGTVAAVALVTLPIVGLSSWTSWVNALLLFQQSQHDLHYLFALALPGYVPYVVYVAVAVGVAVIAFWLGRGRSGLARLGVASIVASPSLYRHGFLVARGPVPTRWTQGVRRGVVSPMSPRLS